MLTQVTYTEVITKPYYNYKIESEDEFYFNSIPFYSQ